MFRRLRPAISAFTEEMTLGFMGSTIARGLPVGNSRGLKTQMPDKA